MEQQIIADLNFILPSIDGRYGTDEEQTIRKASQSALMRAVLADFGRYDTNGDTFQIIRKINRLAQLNGQLD